MSKPIEEAAAERGPTPTPAGATPLAEAAARRAARTAAREVGAVQ